MHLYGFSVLLVTSLLNFAASNQSLAAVYSHHVSKREIQLYVCASEKPSTCEGVQGKICYGGMETCDGKPDCIDAEDEKDEICYTRRLEKIRDNLNLWTNKNILGKELICTILSAPVFCDSKTSESNLKTIWIKLTENNRLDIPGYWQYLRNANLLTRQNAPRLTEVEYIKAEQLFTDVFWLFNYDTEYDVLTPFVAERVSDILKGVAKVNVHDTIVNLMKILKELFHVLIRKGFLDAA